MGYQRTQIYLDPGEHRRLLSEAAARGLSLAALLREIVAQRSVPGVERRARLSFGPLHGLIDVAAGDVVRTKDADKIERASARYRKKMGLPSP